jgi:hypothetical protein
MKRSAWLVVAGVLVLSAGLSGALSRQVVSYDIQARLRP